MNDDAALAQRAMRWGMVAGVCAGTEAETPVGSMPVWKRTRDSLRRMVAQAPPAFRPAAEALLASLDSAVEETRPSLPEN